MIISEKGLFKAMSDAAVHGGYRIRFNEDENTITILTDEWLVNVELDIIPRKVTGIIAEHFGYIPRAGSYCVKKYKDEYDVQTYLHDTFSADVIHLAHGEALPAIPTGVSAWNRALYVSQAGELMGARQVNLALLDVGMQPQMISGKSLMYTDEDSAVFIGLCDSSGLTSSQQAIWGSLVAIEWWGSTSPESQVKSTDDVVQMELEERDESEGADNAN